MRIEAVPVGDHGVKFELVYVDPALTADEIRRLLMLLPPWLGVPS